MTNSQIVGVDIPWFDEIITLPRLPKENGSAPIVGITRQGGGKVSTALVAAARLGIRCGIVARLGLGRWDDYLLEDFARHGIDTSGVTRNADYRCGFSAVLNEQALGGRRILWQQPSQGGPSRANIHACAAHIRGARYLHLCRMQAGDLAAAHIARESGVPVCFDADFYTEEVHHHLPLVDILIGSEEFYDACLAGGAPEANLRALRQELGLSVVIFTFGSRGCKGIDEDGAYFELPAFSQGITVVDTVGAGDVFHGAWLAGRCHGLTTRAAARYASAAAAIKCTLSGGRAGIPDKALLTQYLDTGTLNAAPLLQRQALYHQLSQAL